MFPQDRDAMRRFFCEVWRKAGDGGPLEPLEVQIVAVIRTHPEYHGLLEQGGSALARDFLPGGPETNPFLHLGLHLTLVEQVTTDRPTGVRALYRHLVATHGDPHQAEHRMMDCLAQALWEAQRSGAPPDDAAYLGCLRQVAPPKDRGEDPPGKT